MTGREGETFPGFFMAEEGSRIRMNERSARRREKAMAWECPHWEFAAIYGAGRGIWQGAPPAFWWRCIRRRAERQGGGCIARGPFRRCL